MKPLAIVLSGYGLNCEAETRFAFETAGANADIVHVNDLIARPSKLSKYQIMAIPGGFSYGDDTGSGKAFANRLKNNLSDVLAAFLQRDTLMIGICNGFQILTSLGLLPGALTTNTSARYLDRWVDLKITGESPWLCGIATLSVPIAHGEGRYIIAEKELLKLQKGHRIGAQYVRGPMCRSMHLPANPNGAMGDVASVLGSEGRVLGMMPHPERASFFTQLPDWPLRRERLLRQGSKPPRLADGIKVFQNAVRYFL